MASKPAEGVTRKITYQAWCHKCGLGWRATTERQFKSEAMYDLAIHNMDVHGGTPRRGQTEPTNQENL